MGLYLEIYQDDGSQRSIVKVENNMAKDFVGFRVLYAEPGAEDEGVVDAYSRYPINSLDGFYRDGATKAIYKIKSKLEQKSTILTFIVFLLYTIISVS